MLDPQNFAAELSLISPGRINLIGEHIDYNGGHVLPAAIDKSIKFRFRRNGGERCRVHSLTFDKFFELGLDELKPSKTETWQNYIIGMLHGILDLKPGSLNGFDCLIESDLPLGAGLSSSAALECGLAKGLDLLFGIGLTEEEIVRLSMLAEHNFVGTKCGIMDQFAVVHGKAKHLILLNCETGKHELVEADFAPYTIVLLNTNVEHSLASTEYNTRREECEIGLKTILEKHPEYKNLVEIPTEIIWNFHRQLPTKVYNRALYVTQENQRTLKAVDCLRNKDFTGFGACLYGSHDGLRHLYEVSCEEADFLVDYTQAMPQVLGARMMGGGFGGCTINLVHRDYVQAFIDKASQAYSKRFGKGLTPIQVKISDGVRAV